MIIGGTLSPREIDSIRKRLQTIRTRCKDKRILEQVRMINLVVNKAERRQKGKVELKLVGKGLFEDPDSTFVQVINK